MVDEAGFVSTKDAVNGLPVSEFHQAGKADRIVKAPSALGFFLRDELPLVFDQALTPFDVFAGKQA